MHTVHRTQPWSQAFPSTPPFSRERGKDSGNKVAYNLMSGHLMRIYCFVKGARFKYNVFGDHWEVGSVIFCYCVTFNIVKKNRQTNKQTKETGTSRRPSKIVEQNDVLFFALLLWRVLTMCVEQLIDHVRVRQQLKRFLSKNFRDVYLSFFFAVFVLLIWRLV